MAFVSGIRYPKNAPQTEQGVDDYYDNRKIELQSQYESRARDIDTKWFALNDDLTVIQTTREENIKEISLQIKTNNEELTRLKTELDTIPDTDVTQLDEQISILSDEIDEQSKSGYVSRNTADKYNKLVLQRDELLKPRLQGEKLNTEIERLEANNKALESLGVNVNEKTPQELELESKQKKLDTKRDILTSGLEEDIEKNEEEREKVKEKLEKLIPNDPRDVEFYTFGVYSDGTKRMGIVKVNAVINLPKDYATTAIPNDVMLELAKQAWQYIYDIGENPVPTENIEWEFKKPTSKGSATYFFADSYTNDDAITPELDGYSYLPAENAWKRLG